MSVILCTDDIDGDLTLLSQVNEEATVQKLNERFSADKIYTTIGPVLVAVNPYKRVTFPNGQYVCDRKVIDAYQGREMHEMAPHPFGVASECCGKLKFSGKNQCIIITGESGAGKTETSKFIMEFICATSAMDQPTKKKARGSILASESDQVKSILLASNPVLESFGNAQTIRNNNSSRFGKYMVLQFNFLNQVVGGFITNYLLEKSRVVQQTDKERNFHVFYQLVAGASAEKKARWKIDDAKRHKYMSNEHRKIEGKDDAAEMATLLEQLSICGIDDDNQDAIFGVLSGLLHIGDLLFAGDDEANISNADVLEKVAGNLGLPDDVVANAVTLRTISVGRETHKVLLEPQLAEFTRDSMSKALYERIFQYLVSEINAKMDSKSASNKSIGILDIYGFEIFDHNSFEQMCINYVNEKLQQVFVELTLKAEQEEYTREGIDWEPVTYFDNKTVCDLIESNRNPVGLLALLDEQCLIANPTDAAWLNKINNLYDGKHAHFKKSRMAGTEFTIAHYAGDVKYSVDGFITKNSDKLFNDVIEALQQSSLPFLAKLFEDNRSELEKKKRPPTTSTMFKQQVNVLMETLTACEPHYIRTIKPNDVKRSGVFTTDRVQHQVKYLGLVENIRIRRAGFAYRQRLDRFLARFKAVSSRTWPFPADRTTTAGAAVEMLLLDSDNVKCQGGSSFVKGVKGDGAFQIGNTKIFIRTPEAYFALERLRSLKLPMVAKCIQKVIRSFQFRCKLYKMITLHGVIKKAMDSVAKNTAARIVTRGPNLRLETEPLFKNWETLEAKYLKSGTTASKKLYEGHKSLAVSLCAASLKAKLQRLRFNKKRKAAVTFQASWKGLSHRKKMDKEMWDSCHNAMLGVRSELEKYHSIKQRRRVSFDREEEGIYVPEIGSTKGVLKLLTKHQQEKVYFAAQVMKINKRWKEQGRTVLVTNQFVFNLEPKTAKEKRRLAISEILSVSMSTLPDNFVIIHAKDYDYIMILEQKLELVKILKDRYWFLKSEEMKINFSDDLEAKNKSHKIQKFSFRRSTEKSGSTWAVSKTDKTTMVVDVHDDSSHVGSSSQ